MKLLNMLKKDFLITKPFVLVILSIAILMPLFINWRMPEVGGDIGFIITAIFSLFMLVQFVCAKENQYPKAAALLCAAPYRRSQLVLSKYAFCMISFICCCVIYGIETMFFTTLYFNYELTIITFFIVAVFFGFYFPLQFKLGYDKVRLVFILIFFGVPLLSSKILTMLELGRVNLAFVNSIHLLLLYGGIVAGSLFILGCSAIISIKIYDTMDLV